jgi:hypothetical protein
MIWTGNILRSINSNLDDVNLVVIKKGLFVDMYNSDANKSFQPYNPVGISAIFQLEMSYVEQN